MFRCVARLLSSPSSEQQIVASLGGYTKGRILTSAWFERYQIQSYHLIRLHSTPQTYNNPKYSFTDSYLNSRKTDVEFEPNRSEDVVLHIARWFDCSDEEASSILDSMPQLRCSHLERIDGYVDFLKENGITVSLLRQNLWLLEQSITTMRPKIQIVSQLGINSDIVPLLKAGRRSLRRYVLSKGASDLESRFAFLAKSLECPREEVVNLIMRDCRWYLLSMGYEKLVFKLVLLLDHGVAPSDIRNDLWVLNYSERHLKDRLHRVKAVEVEPIKPWMLRCTDRSFHTMVERRQLSKTIVANQLEYLAERLGYGHREIASLVTRYTTLTSMSVVKMKSAFDLLYAYGISSEQIYRFPIILCRSLKRLEYRLKELNSLGLKAPKRLHVLSWPANKYEKELQEMKRNNKIIKEQNCDVN